MKAFKIIRKLYFLLLLLIPLHAQAIFYPPEIIPTEPNSNQFIQFSISTAICDIFTINSQTGYQIELIGNRVIFTATGTSVTNPTLCFFPLRNYLFNIGTLPPGDYMLEVYRRQGGNPAIVDLVQTANFTVSAGADLAVPSMNNFSLIFLALSFLLVGICSKRHFFQ